MKEELQYRFPKKNLSMNERENVPCNPSLFQGLGLAPCLLDRLPGGSPSQISPRRSRFRIVTRPYYLSESPLSTGISFVDFFPFIIRYMGIKTYSILATNMIARTMKGTINVITVPSLKKFTKLAPSRRE